MFATTKIYVSENTSILAVNNTYFLLKDDNQLVIVEDLDSIANQSMNIVLTLILSFLFVFGFLFNFISLSSILCAKAFTPINLLILNLAIADLTYTLGIPMFASHMFTKNWPFGQFGCRMFILTDFVGLIVSILSICCLSVERFFEVADKKKRIEKFSNEFKTFATYVYMVVCWLVAFFFSFMMIPTIKLKTYSDISSCVSTWTDSKIKVFFSIKFVFIFALPLIIITISSTKLLLFLNKWRSHGFSVRNQISKRKKMNPTHNYFDFNREASHTRKKSKKGSVKECKINLRVNDISYCEQSSQFSSNHIVNELSSSGKSSNSQVTNASYILNQSTSFIQSQDVSLAKYKNDASYFKTCSIYLSPEANRIISTTSNYKKNRSPSSQSQSPALSYNLSPPNPSPKKHLQAKNYLSTSSSTNCLLPTLNQSVSLPSLNQSPNKHNEQLFKNSRKTRAQSTSSSNQDTEDHEPCLYKTFSTNAEQENKIESNVKSECAKTNKDNSKLKSKPSITANLNRCYMCLNYSFGINDCLKISDDEMRTSTQNLTFRVKNKHSVRIKASRLVLTIVLLFFIQWTPLWVFQLFVIFSNHQIEHVQLINLVITTLSYSNTIANPIIYMLATYNFKEYCQRGFLKFFFK